MTAAAVVLLALVLLLIAGVHVAVGDRALRSRTKRRVMVTTRDGAWFAGVLYEHDRRSVVLRSTTTETADGATATVDGEVLILTEDVAHIQFP